MTPREQFEQAWDRYWRIILTACAIGISWASLTASVGEVKARLDTKASKSQVEALETRVEAKQDAILYLLCGDPRNAKDTQCKDYRR